MLTNEILTLLVICPAMWAAFALGAWVRQPFALWPAGRKRDERKTGAEADSEELRRRRQLEAMLGYSLDDARRAARDGEA